MTALVETQDKYNQLSAKLTMDMEALKAAVERSNREKDINIQSAIKNASEAILSDLKGVVDSYKAEVEQATERLQAATKKKDDKQSRPDRSSGRLLFILHCFPVRLSVLF